MSSVEVSSVEPEPSAVVDTARQAMVVMAHALGMELGEQDDAGLSLLIDSLVPVNIAPASERRIAMFCQLAQVHQVSQEMWIDALSEAAEWGFEGETLRFVVLDRFFTLLWSLAPPCTAEQLLYQLQSVIARAVAVARTIHSAQETGPGASAADVSSPRASSGMKQATQKVKSGTGGSEHGR